jgi:hypothetical protein
MLIALLNKSTRYAGNGNLLTQIAAAVNQQLVKHVAPGWGMTAWNCIYFKSEKDVPVGSYRLWILDDADQADALGYHDQDADGVPYGRVFVNPIIKSGGTDFSGPNSVSVTISHEACEMMVDPEVNMWRQMSDGRLTCQEVCDAVQGDAYGIDISGKKIFVSNFLLPAWFDYAPVKGAKFDYMKKLKKNFSMSKFGYMILLVDGNIDFIFGSKAAEAEYSGSSSKKHVAARSAKRQLKFKKQIIESNISSLVDSKESLKPSEVKKPIRGRRSKKDK